MTVTLADVAARAQVSPATVSRVLNGNYPVAASTRERVLKAVDELDYVLNGPASALAAATSDLVGILVNDIADPFFGIMASAIQAEIGGPGGRAGGERLAVVCNTGGSPERELTYLTLLQRQRAAAVVLTGGAIEDAAHQAAMDGEAAQADGRRDAGGALRAAAGAGDRGDRADLRQPRGRAGADRAPDRARPPAARLYRGARRSGPRPGTGWRATGPRWPRTGSRRTPGGRCTGGTTGRSGLRGDAGAAAA